MAAIYRPRELQTQTISSQQTLLSSIVHTIRSPVGRQMRNGIVTHFIRVSPFIPPSGIWRLEKNDPSMIHATPERQCRQNLASGLMDSRQNWQMPPCGISVGTTKDRQCLHFSAFGSMLSAHSGQRDSLTDFVTISPSHLEDFQSYTVFAANFHPHLHCLITEGVLGGRTVAGAIALTPHRRRPWRIRCLDVG